MNKAVLVIDMPKRCKDCFRYRADAWFGGRCTQAKEDDGWDKKIEADEEYDVQKWCPLRPHQEAIPIEWMYEWRIKNNEQYNVGLSSFSQMISDWEKENGRSE